MHRQMIKDGLALVSQVKLNVLKQIKMNSDVYQSLAEEDVLSFIFCLHLEKKTGASMFFADEVHGYHLESDGVEVSVKVCNGQLYCRFQSKTITSHELVELNVATHDLFTEAVEQVSETLSQIKTDSHNKVLQHQKKLLIDDIKSHVIKKTLNQDSFISPQYIESYGIAMKELIESGELFKLPYFRRSIRFSSDILPRQLISHEHFKHHRNINTTVRSSDKVLLNRVKRFTSPTQSKAAYWGRFNTSNGILETLSSYCISRTCLQIPEEKELFFLNRDGDRIKDVTAFPDEQELTEMMFGAGSCYDKEYFYPEDLTVLITVLSKQRSMDSYLMLPEGFYTTSVLEVKGRYFIVNASAMHDALREVYNYSKHDYDVVELRAYQDRLVLINKDSDMTFSLMAKEISADQAYDVDFVHGFDCLFDPIPFMDIVLQSKKMRVSAEGRVVSKIDAIVSKHFNLR